MLSLENVIAGYIPGVEILRGVNLRVEQGEMVCIVGPNGAGKSTVLRAVSGLIRISTGRVAFNGESLGGLRPEQILTRGIAHVPQGHSVFPKMTIYENLLMGAYTVKDRATVRRRLDKVYGLFPFLKDRAKEKAGNLSGGQQKVLEMGRALMLEPPLMMLDEPSLGLAPKTMANLFDTIKDLSSTGLTILMVEQNARQGLAASHRGYVLELGKEKFEGTAKELLESPEMAKLYLGGSTENGGSYRRQSETAGAQ
ncbi:MAG TPA: ABC transporter ATP-binding protein, partial [Anaerolineales bacterium]|nr:ABC transporter ATP-binding protein [Anaerolineales bacterium]